MSKKPKNELKKSRSIKEFFLHKTRFPLLVFRIPVWLVIPFSALLYLPEAVKAGEVGTWMILDALLASAFVSLALYTYWRIRY